MHFRAEAALRSAGCCSRQPARAFYAERDLGDFLADRVAGGVAESRGILRSMTHAVSHPCFIRGGIGAVVLSVLDGTMAGTGERPDSVAWADRPRTLLRAYGGDQRVTPGLQRGRDHGAQGRQSVALQPQAQHEHRVCGVRAKSASSRPVQASRNQSAFCSISTKPGAPLLKTATFIGNFCCTVVRRPPIGMARPPHP